MDRTLTLLYTADTHGYLFPTAYADTRERDMGLMKLAAAFPRGENTLIIDGGDTIQGSPLTNLFHRLPAAERAACLTDSAHGTHPIAAMMNLAGYQFVTPGNHDFNNGLDALGDYLTQLNAQCLCANIRDRAGRLPIAPYAVHRLANGLRVGIVGVCTHFISVWEKPQTVAQLAVEDAFDAAARLLPEVRRRSDITVLVYHGGYERDLTTGQLLSDTGENQACRMCAALDYDIVLTGHQHIAQPGARFGHSYTVQPGYRAPHACAVTVTVRGDGTKSCSSALLPASAPAMPEATALLAPLERRVQAWLDTPAGRLDRPLPTGDRLTMAVEGSLLANFINTVMRELSGAQVCACPIPNDVAGLGREVTVRDVVSTYIYTNTLVVLELTGETLRQYIERTAAYFGRDAQGNLAVSDEFLRPKVMHYNYDFFSGIDYVIDARKPIGQRVVSVKLGGRELTDEETVSVCVSSYRASGTAGYTMLRGQRVLADIQTDVADAIIDYITARGDIRVDTHRYLTVLT